jgi:hypothetical protein
MLDWRPRMGFAGDFLWFAITGYLLWRSAPER